MRRLSAIMLCIGVLYVCPTRASGLWLGGVEAGPDSSYAFVGAIVPLPGSRLGQGWIQRYRIEGLDYSYRDSDTTVDARAYGVGAALGLQRPLNGGGYGASLGLIHRDTDLSPDQPGRSVRGAQTRAETQLEFDKQWISGIRLGWLGSYTFVSESYWTRFRVMFRRVNQHEIGPEFIAQGDPDYSAQQAGIAYTGLKMLGSQLALKAGVRRTEGAGTSGYAGFELVYAF